MLLPPRPGTPLHVHLLAQGQTSEHITNHPFWQTAPAATGESDVDGSPAYLIELGLKRAWRVDTETIDALRDVLSGYLGTHNFHNFTVHKEYKDRTCLRHMKELIVHPPTVRDGIEWISILFHGQSFILHQIVSMCHNSRSFS